ncbi:calpain-9-like isoform X2 [Biomphalaria glabrata]|uniref:Calpain-9-like isoform X2 n=1 Tax=Biomphalaria glabrata TaxID=6526 RepID=A0A2C9LA51_BIOGL|nr:calpain-9-like isoform X2 [Biomphalaria glabrata]KAI8729645.1 calpain-9 [Biomphalaria glabrata]
MASVYEELKKQYLKSNKLYEDPKFLTNSTFLFKGGPRFGVKWLRPKELVKNPQFIADGFAYNDFDQGGLGNCWFIASVACLSASDHKEILKRIVPADQNFDKDYFGAFRFNFWQYGKWVEIVVDDRLPTYNGKLIYGCNKKNPNEFWCSLLEKAFAKLHGNYDVIDGGRIHSSLVDLTGGIGEMVPLRQEIADRDLRNILVNCSKMNSIMGAAIFNQLAVPGERELKRDTGLYEGHAYAIINIKEVNIKHSTVTLLHLRNPWGHGEWNGPFSDKSPEWNLLSQADKDATLKTKDDGEFWISLTDFRTNFDELEICHLTPDAFTEEISHNLDRSQWAVTEHYGSWVSGVSAGGPPLSFTSRKFWINPQFELSLSHANKPTTVIISLFEVDDLLRRAAEDISIGFVILKHNRVRSKPSRITAENFSEYAPRLVETSGKYWPYRERTKRYLLEPGEHIIIPCTFKAGLEAEFYLRVFAETPIDSQPVNVPKNNADIVPSSPKDTSEYAIMKAFDGIVGRDGFIDAADLVIVFQAGLEAAGEGKGFNIETCRCITGLSDIQSSKGLIDKEGVRKVWSDLQNWRKAFRLIDTDKNNAVDANELQKLFETIDFNAGPEAVAAIMKRYGGKNGKISEEDFLQCFCKTMHLFRTYKELSTGGKITMSLNQWISVGLRT